MAPLWVLYAVAVSAGLLSLVVLACALMFIGDRIPDRLALTVRHLTHHRP